MHASSMQGLISIYKDIGLQKNSFRLKSMVVKRIKYGFYKLLNILFKCSSISEVDRPIDKSDTETKL